MERSVLRLLKGSSETAVSSARGEPRDWQEMWERDQAILRDFLDKYLENQEKKTRPNLFARGRERLFNDWRWIKEIEIPSVDLPSSQTMRVSAVVLAVSTLGTLAVVTSSNPAPSGLDYRPRPTASFVQPETQSGQSPIASGEQSSLPEEKDQNPEANPDAPIRVIFNEQSNYYQELFGSEDVNYLFSVQGKNEGLYAEFNKKARALFKANGIEMGWNKFDPTNPEHFRILNEIRLKDPHYEEIMARVSVYFYQHNHPRFPIGEDKSVWVYMKNPDGTTTPLAGVVPAFIDAEGRFVNGKPEGDLAEYQFAPPNMYN